MYSPRWHQGNGSFNLIIIKEGKKKVSLFFEEIEREKELQLFFVSMAFCRSWLGLFLTCKVFRPKSHLGSFLIWKFWRKDEGSSIRSSSRVHISSGCREREDKLSLVDKTVAVECLSTKKKRQTKRYL